MDLASNVVPVELDADVFLAFPILFEIVMCFGCVYEVLCVFLADILGSEIFDNECKLGWAPFVFPESWYDGALVVAPFVEAGFEELPGEDASLG